MSLESCIRKAGKALDKEDADAIRALRDDIFGAGDVTQDEANKQAVSEYLTILNGEREEILKRVEEAGGYLANPRLGPSDFAKQAAKNLDKAAKTFPRKGIVRPPPEKVGMDYKSGTVLEDSFYERNKALNYFERNIRDYRTARSIKMLWPDFYSMSPDQVLAIVANFDAKAALGLAKHFNLIPQPTRSLDPKKWQWNQKELAKHKLNVEANTKKNSLHNWSERIILKWVEDKETLPLYFKVEDPATRDFADTNPDSPMSVLFRHAELMRETEQKEKVGLRTLRKLKNWLRDNVQIKGVLGAVPQDKLEDFVQYGMPSVPAYTDLVKEMDAWMNKELEPHHEEAMKWLKFINQSDDGGLMLSEFFSASTLAGVDVPTFEVPDAATYKKMNKEKRAEWDEKKVAYKKLKPFWEKLGKMGERSTYEQKIYDAESGKDITVGMPMEVSEAQRIYLVWRDAFARERDMMMQFIEDRINAVAPDDQKNTKAELIARMRQEFEVGKINPYFVLGRFGLYAAVAKDKSGEIAGFIKRENSEDRDAWMRAMRKEGFYVTPFENEATDIQMMQQIDPAFVAQVTDLLGDTSVIVEHPDTGEPVAVPGSTVQDDIWQMYLSTLMEKSMRKSYMTRIGRLGFTSDALRSFSDRAFHGVHQLAKLKFGHQLVDQLQNVEEESQTLLQRQSHIKNLKAGWRPEGYEDASIHEVMMAGAVKVGEGTRIIGGADYKNLYAKMLKQLGDEKEAQKQALDRMEQEAKVDGPWAVPISSELKRRHAYNMNPRSAPWSTKLTALGFVWFLSTSPAAGILNLSQTAISAYPILRARFNKMGAGQELLKASKEYASHSWVGMHKDSVKRFIATLKKEKVANNEGKEIDVGDAAALIEMEERGLFSKTRTRELMGLSEAGSAYSHKQEKYLEVAGYIFHKTEEMNRVVTSLAAYRLARKRNLTNKMSEEDAHAQAIEEALKLTLKSHYDYTNTNRPRFMQGDLGRVVFLFRNFSLNMTYRLMRDFRDGIWKNDMIPIEARREAKSQFLGMLGMTSIFAGLSGMPMFWLVEGIANNLFGDDDDPFDSKTEMRKLVFNATSKYMGEIWGERLATAVMKGPWSAFTGADLSQRASLNNLWWRDIPTNLKDDKRGLLLYLAGEAAGPLFGIGMNFEAGFSNMQQDAGFLRTAEKFVPKFVADIMKTMRFATQGAQTYERDIIVPPEAFTNHRLFLQTIGFTPTYLADRYDQNRAIKDMEQKLRGRRQDLINKLFLAWKLEDRQDARKAMRNIVEWNKKNPRYPIDARTIQQSARARAQNDMRTVGGVAVDKRLQYLQHEMKFVRR